MNIKEAKIQITNTLKAYLEKDELGNYMIPSVRQRPVLLMGPPGVGKTQIMEQIAAETGVALVAYTITHHTRQSAIGLPFIEKRVYDGEEQTVTEYTMSEILASVYTSMEKTGIKEGILFLDEINCVSETLAPMMLQFLQCKTFGNRKLPEGWLIVAAGNPPEYNRSVRDFDVVTLDRVRLINVEESFPVWKEYAVKKGLHGSVISYLDIKKDNFYRIETAADGMQFATARAWEDLSEVVTVHEKLGLPVDLPLVEQYIRIPRIARDYVNYYLLYNKYRRTYHVEDILAGNAGRVIEMQFSSAAFDEKLSVMGLLVSRLSEEAGRTRKQDALVSALYDALLEFKARAEAEDPQAVLESLLESLRSEMRRENDSGRNDREKLKLLKKEENALQRYLDELEKNGLHNYDEAVALIRREFSAETETRLALADSTGAMFDNAFAFLERAAGVGQETVLFVTEMTAGYETSWFVQTFGCEAYFRHSSDLMFDDTRRRILDEIKEI